MVELLRKVWQLNPDLRLTQLVINATGTEHNCGPVYYMEDTIMEKKLMAELNARREVLPPSATAMPPLRSIHHP